MLYHDFVNSRIKWLDSNAADLIHATVGLVGEVVEFMFADSPENAIEELGDCEFYVSHLRQALEKAPFKAFAVSANLSRDESNKIVQNPTDSLLKHSGELLDFAKKVFIYNKPGDKLDWANQIVRVEYALHVLCHNSGTSRLKTQIANQTKLEIRYPTGYSDQAAQARADKA